MKVKVAAIGKLKSGSAYELVCDYRDRIKGIGKSVGVTDFQSIDWDAPKSLDGLVRQQKEAAWLQETTTSSIKKIVLDERGKALSTAEFSNLFGGWIDAGISESAFLIGGADGHLAETRQAADLTLSLGALTLPHLLARVILVEQIYRVCTVLAGHPYHRV
ncbi:MAG: 23S rRNA (pseudouridine(1915)-N(3))-methyltransferase RlmH [Pseudomonadota bacterium]